MRIGLTFTTKGDHAAAKPTASRVATIVTSVPNSDDAEEEFDSPETIAALAQTLTDLGHEVELLGDGEPLLRRLLDGPRPDLVFNIAEGRGISRSREARVPAVLEMLGIPFTGSDPLCLAATLDKDCAKRLVAAAGIATPEWVLVDDETAADDPRLLKLKCPLVIKPAFEGSSKGIRSTSFIQAHDELPGALAELRAIYRQPILVEEFIDGEELTVGVVGNPPEVLGVMRMLPTRHDRPFLYSLEVKRDWQNQVRYESPARLPAADIAAIEQATLAAWRALGCRDFGRFDFRLRDHVPYFLETNPLPGLSPKTGDIVFLSRGVGIEHPELIRRILAAALDRLERESRPTEACAAKRPGHVSIA